MFSDKPAITTNYDRVLEHVYRIQGIPFDHVFGPDSSLATLIGQQNLHCLFKIHGDIGTETLDGRKLILSGKSYDRVYGPESELNEMLSTFYKGKMMLFLGSSLKYDRTLRVLNVITEKSQVSHYAILPCKQELIDDNNCFFGNSGIRTIFYDPEHHESVRILLEELLRSTNPEKFISYKSLKKN